MSTLIPHGCLLDVAHLDWLWVETSVIYDYLLIPIEKAWILN